MVEDSMAVVTDEMEALMEHSNISITLSEWPAAVTLISFAMAVTVCFCKYMDGQDKKE